MIMEVDFFLGNLAIIESMIDIMAVRKVIKTLWSLKAIAKKLGLTALWLGMKSDCPLG